MELLELPGKATLPLLTAAEVASWEATNPADRSCVVNIDAGVLLYWDNAAGESVQVPWGRQVHTSYVSVADGEDNYTNTGLIGATVTKVFRPAGLYQPVTGTPANTFEIKFDTATGELSLITGDQVEGGEVWCIEYYGVPPIAGV